MKYLTNEGMFLCSSTGSFKDTIYSSILAISSKLIPLGIITKSLSVYRTYFHGSMRQVKLNK